MPVLATTSEVQRHRSWPMSSLSARPRRIRWPWFGRPRRPQVEITGYGEQGAAEHPIRVPQRQVPPCRRGTERRGRSTHVGDHHQVIHETRGAIQERGETASQEQPSDEPRRGAVTPRLDRGNGDEAGHYLGNSCEGDDPRLPGRSQCVEVARYGARGYRAAGRPIEARDRKEERPCRGPVGSQLQASPLRISPRHNLQPIPPQRWN